MAVGDHNIWTSKDYFRVLLFTLPVRTTAHDLGTLLDGAGGKTCIINCFLDIGNKFCCAVVSFEFERDLDSIFHTEPIFGGVCGRFGHLVLKCNAPANNILSSSLAKSSKDFVSEIRHLQLAKLYQKKDVPISCPVAFGGKSWAQVVSVATSLSHGLSAGSGLGSLPSSHYGFGNVSFLNNCLASLECLLELLFDQVSIIIRHLASVELVPLVFLSFTSPFDTSASSALSLDSDMVLGGALMLSAPHPFSAAIVGEPNLGSSSFKVLTGKVGGLESKLAFLEASIGSMLAHLDDILNVPAKQVDVLHWHVDSGFTISFVTETKLRSSVDIGFLGAGVAVIMNNSLACHVSKVEEVPGRVVAIWLLFKNKLLVSVIGLYASASSGVCFGQASEVNSLIAKAVNSSIFVVLDGNFNENGSGRSASFRFCSNLGLVNLFSGYSLVGATTWGNFRGVERTIDFIFVSENLISAVAGHRVGPVLDFFNTDHNAVMVSVGLGGLLNVCLNSLHKQANKDCWKFNIKNADVTGWSHFRDHSSVMILEIKNDFLTAAAEQDLDAISANTFGFDCLVRKWSTLDANKALMLMDMVQLGQRKVASKLAQKAFIREAIEKCMEKFCSDKDSMIRSVLDQPFQKVVLDHLVIDDELVLEPKKYAPLAHVKDDAFFGVMSAITLDELLLVVGDLPDDKAAVPALWKRAWVSMIPKPYDWNGVLTNTCPITLIETARKILSDRISLACSRFGILRDDNFSDMHKAYNSVGWHHLRANLRHIKMCGRFIDFFGNIHENRVNRVMTDFGLLSDYRVHDGFDQSEVFLPLLWKIFYDLLLCEVKRHEHLCSYHIDTKFVTRTGRIKNGGGMSFFFAVGAFVDDTIWVGDCQASMQYALNITSEFFYINDISINNEKTMAIPINQGVKVATLGISGQPISIARKSEAYRYLGIFLSTEKLSKPSLAKVYLDVCFFVNRVLRKVIMDKQFFYLVLAVLQFIVSYYVLVRKGFRSKACLPCDFSNAALHYSSLYGLKSFEQMQFERKMASLVSFANASGILGCLFEHRFLDLQVLSWTPLNLFQYSVKLCVSLVNNFLASVVKILMNIDLSLVNNLPNAFCHPGRFLMPSILRKSLYFNSKHLDPQGSVPLWFTGFFFSCSSVAVQSGGLNVLESDVFSSMQNGLYEIWSGCFETYMDGSLKGTGTADVLSGVAAYFPALGLGVGVKVCGLLFSIMAELQAVALALKCVLSSSSVVLYFNSQAAINACVSKMLLEVPDFCNHCWIERRHVFDLIRDKNFSVNWIKVKGHAGVLGNVKADRFVGEGACFSFVLLMRIRECFLVADDTVVSGNAHHFVKDVFRSICHACWEAGLSWDVVSADMLGDFDWAASAKVWHLDSHMLAGFTSYKSADLCTYLMKALHKRLPMVVRKRLYNKCYSDVQCLLCGKIELSDYVFTCSQNVYIQREILLETSVHWALLVGAHDLSSFSVLQIFNFCHLDIGRYSVLCKGFMMKVWCAEAVDVFDDVKKASCIVVDFVRFLVELY
ncbi:hypothetical protein G9A89_013907 [Geosiphon pyriformis]|nr:hypothetical protein G9A89_013907 [Geosiphon pyriformis]